MWVAIVLGVMRRCKAGQGWAHRKWQIRMPADQHFLLKIVSVHSGRGPGLQIARSTEAIVKGCQRQTAVNSKSLLFKSVVGSL